MKGENVQGRGRGFAGERGSLPSSSMLKYGIPEVWICE